LRHQRASGTAGAAQRAHARSIASTEAASKNRAEADRQNQLLIEKETELSELASAYGSDYQQIVTELEQLAADQEQLDQETTELANQERDQDKALATAQADLRALEQSERLPKTREQAPPLRSWPLTASACSR